MRFDSLYFLFFFVLVFGLSRIRHLGPAVYILASFAFYMVAGWQDLALIAGMVVINYLASFFVQKKKPFLILAIILNLLPLLYFKYGRFLGEAFLSREIFDSAILIPLGISFYTFQMIAYQVDLARGSCQLIRSFPRFFLFVTFFPQLIAGPIVRAHDISSQIDRLFERGPRKTLIYSLGLGLCLLGLVKKVLLADALAPFVDDAFAHMPANTGAAWQGAVIFGFQIYYDFSGYSDIALGLGYLLGVRLPVNFRQPYLAQSPQEFWQRWHITLSSWVRDYIYIPLGGNQIKGAVMQAAALLFVMGTMGMWHGANWTFGIWGLGWGMSIFIWRYAGPYIRKIPGLSWALTMLVVFVLWVFFRAPDTLFAMKYIGMMFSFDFRGYSFPFWLWAGVLGMVLFHKIEGCFYNIEGVRFSRRFNSAFYWGVLFGLCLCIVILPKALNNPFIYFRF